MPDRIIQADPEQDVILALRLLAAAEELDLKVEKGATCEWSVKFKIEGNLTFPRNLSEQTIEESGQAFQVARDLIDYFERADQVFRRHDPHRVDNGGHPGDCCDE